MRNCHRRIVVSGLGCVTPLGNNLSQTWEGIIQGRSGISSLPYDASKLAVSIAGTIKDFDISPYISQKEARRLDLFMQYGIAAALQAMDHADLQPSGFDPHRFGVCIGSGIGGIENIEVQHNIMLEKGPGRLSPFFVPGTITNMAAGNISILANAKGPNLCITTACAAGTHNIGMAARLIASGDADMMLAGGAEKGSTLLGIGGFAAARALSRHKGDPTKASRPWDVDRDGFVLADGAGIIVLESLEHAQARRAQIIAELVGFGMSGDAYHITSPSESGEGARRAMQLALNDAQIQPESIGYINAHGTSTPLGDRAEVAAVKAIFEKTGIPPMSSTKSMTGHMLGAAGAVESIFTCLALQEQIMPPTINLQTPDPQCDIDLLANQARKGAFDYAMSNSFGFGGTNGSLVFKRWAP